MVDEVTFLMYWRVNPGTMERKTVTSIGRQFSHIYEIVQVQVQLLCMQL